MSHPANPEAFPAALQHALSRKFERIVIFTGAGMSAESGIPTFRSGDNGLWKNFDPATLATPEAWRRDRTLVWGWYEWRRSLVTRAQPHAGHAAIVELQQKLGARVITQNVDDLHERAGAIDVLHLHGSLFQPRCAACGKPHVFGTTPPAASANAHLDDAHLHVEPPTCPQCSGKIRPGVVWFGEDLSPMDLGKAKRWISESDLLVVVGTSGLVQPAAGLVRLAPRDTPVLEINPEPGPRNNPRILRYRTTAERGLPSLTDFLIRL